MDDFEIVSRASLIFMFKKQKCFDKIYVISTLLWTNFKFRDRANKCVTELFIEHVDFQ